MPIDRSVFSVFVDDDGSGTTGTIWDKQAIEDAILDPIDAALLGTAAAIDDTGDLSFAARSELTIATGAVVVTKNVHSIDTESNAASDDLDTLTAGTSVRDHHFLILQPESASRVVTVKHGTGNIQLKGGDFAMSDANHRLVLYKDGASWFELARNASTGVSGITNSGSDVTQIKFAATQSASADANTLDDYEEGTWTPVVGGAGGTSGQTYTTQTGRYIKIGKLVFISSYVLFSNKGTITGALIITGLPFTCSSSTSQILNVYTQTLAVAVVDVSVYTTTGDTRAEFTHKTAAATNPTQSDTNLVANTSLFILSGCYEATA